MKSFVVILILIVAISSACGPTQPTDPVSVVHAFYDALNAGEVDRAMDLVGNDAKFITHPGVFTGQAQVRDYWQAEVDRGARFELSDVQAEGDTVKWSLKGTSGPVAFETTVEAVVQDGKIVSYNEDV